MASCKVQRSSNRSLVWEIAADFCLTLTLGTEEGAGVDLIDIVSSSVSISVRGRGGGMAGATSKKSQGSSVSSPLW